MPIDSTTVIQHLELSASTSSGIPYGGIIARVRISRRRTLGVPAIANGIWDPNDPEVAEVIRRVKNGLAVRYKISDSALQTALGYDRNGIRDDQLPSVYDHLRNSHPFHSDYVQPDRSKGPYKSIHYHRTNDVFVDLPTTVDFTSRESSAHYRARITAAGWPSEPPTGTATLYWSVVTFGVSSRGSPYSPYSAAANGDVEWSVDGGFNWLTTPPAPFSSVTNTRYRTGAEWIEIRPVEAAESDNPWRQISARSLVVLPTDGQFALEIDGVALGQMYRLGIQMDVMDNNDIIRRSGEAWISTHRIAGDEHPYGLQLLPPTELAQTRPSIPYRYLIAMHESRGQVELWHTGLAPNDSSLGDYDGAYLTFASFPVGTLLAAITDTATTVLMSGGTGIANGDVLYVESEEMLVSSGEGTDTLTVTRGHNGTTAVAHASGVQFRGTVDDEQLRYVHIWDQDNTLAANTRMTVVCLRKV